MLKDKKENNKKDYKKEKERYVIDLTDESEISPCLLHSKRKINYLDEANVESNRQKLIALPNQTYSRVEINDANAGATAASDGDGPGLILPPAILALPAQLNAMQEQMNVIQEQLNAIQGQLNSIPAQMNAILDITATIINRGTSSIYHPIFPLHRFGPIPSGFPPTLKALRRMTNDELAPFLEYYGLSLDGTNRARQKKFAIFLRVPKHLA